jgi:maltose alpha-D-glucosyltransferase/alpha-amylase
MHLALARTTEDADFRPEPLTPLAQRSMYQSMRGLSLQTLRLLRRELRELPQGVHDAARSLLDREQELMDRFARLMRNPVTATRTRTHGDYHLGQVLFTGKDFVIIDFEGEPARSLGERRLKRSPLRDVAGMLDSFRYAAFAALREGQSAGFIRPEDVEPLRPWADYWVRWVSASFLAAYITTANEAPFVPRTDAEVQTLLDSHLLEKAVYDVAYELNNRPDWVGIPVSGILQFLDTTV